MGLVDHLRGSIHFSNESADGDIASTIFASTKFSRRYIYVFHRKCLLPWINAVNLSYNYQGHTHLQIGALIKVFVTG